MDFDQREEGFETLPPAENRRFYPALNGLRAVAVLLVFAEHYIDHDNVFPTLHWGWVGVNIFFVLSGFLITGILFDTQTSENRFRNFYARRALRIFPLYYAIILTAVFLYPIFRWKLYPTWVLLPLYLHNFARFLALNSWLHSQGAMDHLISTRPFRDPIGLVMGHFWSLCVEEQFYLIWPFIVFSVKSRTKLRAVCLYGVILILFLRIGAVFFVSKSYLDADLLNRCLPFCMDALLVGAFLALVQRGPEMQFCERFLRPAFYFFLAFGAAGAVLYRVREAHLYSPSLHGTFMSTFGFMVINVFSGMIVLFALQPVGFFYRLLCSKPLRELGQISYGFYLFHDLFHMEYIALAHRLHLPHSVEAGSISVFAFLVTLFLSFLSFHFFEAPILRYKARF